jgi:hypothetical protein
MLKMMLMRWRRRRRCDAMRCDAPPFLQRVRPVIRSGERSGRQLLHSPARFSRTRWSRVRRRQAERTPPCHRLIFSIGLCGTSARSAVCRHREPRASWTTHLAAYRQPHARPRIRGSPRARGVGGRPPPPATLSHSCEPTWRQQPERPAGRSTACLHEACYLYRYRSHCTEASLMIHQRRGAWCTASSVDLRPLWMQTCRVAPSTHSGFDPMLASLRSSWQLHPPLA